MNLRTQFANNQTGPRKRTGLCMECALRHHDYKEMLRHETADDHTSEMLFPQARIDGRCHVLLSHAWTHQETYVECERKAPSLYLPMK